MELEEKIKFLEDRNGKIIDNIIDIFNLKKRCSDYELMIEELSEENPLLYEHLSAAMRTTAIGDLWPPIKNRKEMKPYYYQFFKNQQK